MVGKLIPDFFPKIFGPSRTSRSTPTRCATAFAELAQEVGGGRTPEEVADGFIQIAVENMANAIKKISVQRGYDVTRYALNCFGGAGGQHACLVADALGMTKVLIHPFSSLLSAYGMGLADIRATRQQAIEEPLGGKALARAQARSATRLGKDAKAEVAGQGVPAGTIKVIVRAHIRYAGTDTRAGGRRPARSPQMKSRLREGAQGALRLHRPQQAAGGRSGLGRSGRRRRQVPRDASTRRRAASSPRPPARTRILLRRQHGTRPRVYTRDQLAPGTSVQGPAIIIEPHQTIVVEDGWRAELTAKNHLVLDAHRAARARQARSAPRPIR